MDTSVKIKNLTVVIGNNFKALDDITLDLPTGKTIGFIGPSGAGKTTLIRAIVGSQVISDGSVEVLGLEAGSKNLRNQVSYMPQELSVYPDLSVKENLAYFAQMKRLKESAKQVGGKVETILEKVNLADKSNSLLKDLSGGQKQRVSLAIALIGSPKLLVLDEPTVGLDPLLRVKLWQLFSDLTKEGITLIISSHSMDEASRCEDLVLLRNGRVITHSTPHDFLEQTSSKSVEEGFVKMVDSKHE